MARLRQRNPALCTRPVRTDQVSSPWTRFARVGIFLAPEGVGFCLESRWLTQAGFMVLFAFLLPSATKTGGGNGGRKCGRYGKSG